MKPKWEIVHQEITRNDDGQFYTSDVTDRLPIDGGFLYRVTTDESFGSKTVTRTNVVFVPEPKRRRS